MRGPRAGAIELSDRQRALLTRLQQRQTACQCLVRRAGILLALATASCIGAVARRLGLTRMTVRHWRDRWLQARPALQVAEPEQAADPLLSALIEQALADAPRPGAPATFRPEQIVQVVAVACEPPEKSDRPLDHWTARVGRRGQETPDRPSHPPTNRGAFFKERPTYSPTAAATG